MSDIELLNENNDQINQPSTLNIKLMSHQKTIVKRMLEVEKDGFIKIDKLTLNNEKINDIKINTNIAILGDKVGAGKTLDIITLLNERPILDLKPYNLGGNKFVSITGQFSYEKCDTNLVLVPHKLIPQWKSHFEKALNLNVLTITTNKQIDNIVIEYDAFYKNWKNEDIFFKSEKIDLDKIKNINVILIGETMFRRFCCSSKNILWNRFIIDEADTIKLTKDLETCIHFNFLWLVTGTPASLFYSSKSVIGSFFKEIRSSISNKLIIKNDDKFIEQSIILPNPKRLCIKCLSPRELNIIKDLIPNSVLQMINAGNSEEAIKALNCNVDTDDNIFQVITKNLVDSINNKKIELEAETKRIYHPSILVEKERYILSIKNQIAKLEEKYNEIKKNIYELNNDYCPVCLDTFNKPVVVKCCNKFFCFDCLAVSLGELHNNNCPHCRQKINLSDLHIISKEIINKQELVPVKKNKNDLKDKLDVLIELIQNKPDGSFMVFANYIETFSKIEKKFKELNITYNILKGQASSVKKHVDEFENKKVQVLMLNAQFFGAGMNLQMTTDLVIYHRFSNDMEEQIIGRAQRYGRNGSLNVYYLLHDNENQLIKDNFKFEDIKNIHYTDWIEEEKMKKITIDNQTLTIDNAFLQENEGILVDGKKNTLKYDDSDLEEIIMEIDNDSLNINNFNLNDFACI
jgi:hypothetical protein